MQALTEGTVAATVSRVVPILMYHSVGCDASETFSPYQVRPEVFADHLDALYDSGYRFVTMSDLTTVIAEVPGPAEKLVVLTFDDAFSDFLDSALPIMERRSIVATVFVTTGFVGGAASWLPESMNRRQRIMSWQALRDITAEGIECGGHSHSHAHLDLLGAHALPREIVRPRVLIEDALGRSVRAFAYPYGHHNARARRAVMLGGYTSACGVDERASRPADDVFALPRITVGPRVRGSDLARLIAAGSRRSRSVGAAKRHLWRAWRRVQASRQGPLAR